MANITVYGADWCPLTRRTLAHLKQRGVEFTYIDIDDDPEAAKWVEEQNGGKQKKPTLNIDGNVLTEPTNDELDQALSDLAA
jgi:glutaredoxin